MIEPRYLGEERSLRLVVRDHGNGICTHQRESSMKKGEATSETPRYKPCQQNPYQVHEQRS